MDKKVRIPEESDDLSARLVAWPKGKTITRIHSLQFAAAEFNPGKGCGRFSPIVNHQNQNIPTLYGGENLPVALMETVLHDLPTPCEHAPVELSVLNKLAHSQLSPKTDIQLVELNPRFMRKHGITQGELIGSSASHYQETRKWAEKVHNDNPDAKGMQWSSRQHGDKAVMLFGDRISENDLEVTIDSEPASTSSAVNQGLTTLADEMALILLPGV